MMRVILGYGGLFLLVAGLFAAATDKPLAWAYVVSAVVCVWLVDKLTDDEG